MILAQNVPKYPIPISPMLFLDMLWGKLERTIIVAIVNVPSDHMPVQSETIERYTILPVKDINETTLPLETALIPKTFNKLIVRETINGIAGAVIQSSCRRKSSYKPKPITAIKGIDTGNTSDRELNKPNTITPIPESKSESSPIEYGGLVIPREILEKLRMHIKIPIIIMIICCFSEKPPVLFFER